MSGLLQGVRVLELGRFVAAPWCGQLLADLGADVIKVERTEGGDQMRRYGPPFLKDESGADTQESSYFIAFNRGKRSITVDMSKPDGQRIVQELARHSHVFIENFKAGHLARFALDEATIRALNPQIVYVSISGFGQSGPYADRPGLDSVFQALGGLMSVTGEPGAPPTKIGLTIVDMFTGLYAALAVLAALRGRETLGVTGQHVDLALLDTAIAVMSNRAQDYLLTGEVPQATGTGTPGSAPGQVFRCSDGWINIQASDDDAFVKLCRVLAREDLPRDVRFAKRSDRWRHRDALLPQIQTELLKRPAAELWEQLLAQDIVCSPIYSLDQTFADPQVQHRGVVHTAQHPAGEVTLIANPIRFSATPVEYAPPPMLGQHTEEILASVLRMNAEQIASLRREGVI